MAVYMIIEVEVRDEETYSEYVEKVRPVVEKYRGCYLVRGGKVITLSGNWSPERIVVIEFPSPEDLSRCFGSEEYREIAPLRERSTIGRSVMVEGYKDPATDEH